MVRAETHLDPGYYGKFLLLTVLKLMIKLVRFCCCDTLDRVLHDFGTSSALHD
jgi:hypothetical protein